MFFFKYLIVKSGIIAKNKVKTRVKAYNMVGVEIKMPLLLIAAVFKVFLANLLLLVNEKFQQKLW